MGAGKTVGKGIELVETFLKELNKPAKATVTVTKVVAPQDEALRLAQQRAALPPAQGGLGLPENNTPMQRAKAMVWKTPSYHGTHADVPVFDSKKNVTAVDFYSSPNPTEVGTYAEGIGGNVMPLMLRGEIKDLTNDSRYLDSQLRKAYNSQYSKYEREYYPFEQFKDSFLNGQLYQDTGGQSSQNALVRELIGSKKSILKIPDAISNGGVGESYVVTNPDNIRSRFAAFDPWRRDAATAAAFGVAAPDLLAKEQEKAIGGDVHMMGGGRPPKKTTLEEDLKSFKDPAIALADLLAGALRGTTTAATGIAGDMEELYRQYGKGAVANAVRLMLPKREGKETTFPTIEEMNAMLPPVVPVGAGRSSQVADIGQFFGENNPFAPTAIAAVKPVLKVAAKGALDLARSEPARKAVDRVMRATGAAPMRVVPEGSRAIAQTPYERSLEQGYNHDWFHGTTGDIKSFDPSLLGESTNANSAKKGFFFARDPQSPPEHLKVKSNDPEAIELLRRFGMSDEEIAKKNAVSFEGHGSSTASDYAGLGGGRDYKEAMRNAALAEKRGDWDAYDKYTQEAEAAVFGERDYRQGLVAKHGDARDQLLHAIDQAFSYGRPEVYKNMSQEDLTNLDKTRQRLMPYNWYMHENAPFEKILEEASKYGTENQLKNLAEEIKNFKSVTNERRLADVEQGANVLPVALRYKNPYVHDFGGASYRDESYSDLIDKALAGDHDALLLLNTFDPGGGKPKMVDVGVVFDPSQIRSRFAEFDPEFIESSDILKKTGGAVMMADGGLTIEEFLRKQGY